MYLVDTANTETEGTTLDTGTVHVVSDQQNQLVSNIRTLPMMSVTWTYTE